ncbi:MAG TPA: CatB-related O-acetyltransferase [Pyrinomonadaceae bacterium]
MLRKVLRKLRSRLTPENEHTALWMAQNKRYSAFEIGVGTYGTPNIDFHDAGAALKIGNYCSIAPRVTILLGGEHHHDWVSNYPFSLLHDEARHLSGYPLTKGDVVIGNDVWIGYEALILSGVKIGDGAVIAARSVVARDIEPYSIVGGAPAKHLRYRFPPEIIEELLKIAWWNWSFAEIRAAWHLIQSPQVEEFVSKYKN